MQIEYFIVVKNKSIETRVKEILETIPIMAGCAVIVLTAREVGPEVEVAFTKIAEPAIMVGSTSIISDAFRDSILPYFYDIGKVIFWCSSAWGLYALMRKNIKDATAKVKWATIGYICLRCLEVFTKLVDRAALDILSRMPK